MDKLSVIELFSGIGSQVAAIKKLGIPYEVVGISEIDKYAIKSYEAINGKTNNYGDISKIESLDYADLWTYSFPCFTGDTLILVYDIKSGKNEYIQIKDFDEEKHLIVTVDEENNVVTDKAKLLKQGIKKIIKIVCSNGVNDFIRCTPEHRFKAYVKTTNTQETEWITDWIEAKDLKFKKLVRFQEMNHQINYLNPVFAIDIKDDGEEEVYDISCETYHWFFVKTNADAVLVHNCQDLSVAGKLAGIKEGTRSGLLLEVERLLKKSIIENKAPKFLLLENVKNLVGKKFKPDFDKWLAFLDSIGYKNEWKVLNAKDYGVPQNRERVFVVSIRKDLNLPDYKFPDKIPLTKRLRDILEKSVDEKYYLKKELNDKFLEQIVSKIENQEYSYCLDANYWKGTTPEQFYTKNRRQLVTDSSTEYFPLFDILKKEEECFPLFLIMGTHTDKNDMARTLCSNYYKQSKRNIVGESGYGATGVAEVMIGTSRRRNPDNSSSMRTGDSTEQQIEVNSQGISNTLTTVQKDNYVVEPNVLVPKRNEYGKAIRKDYEAGFISESRHNMTDLMPRNDGISNTLTTVQKDNYLIEPKDEINMVHLGNALFPDKNYGTNYAGATFDENGLSPTLNTMSGGNRQPYTMIHNNSIKAARIRKLTPKECWRLMGFSDEDFEKAEAVNSSTQLYKEAGNSIVVNVLEAIFRKLIEIA